MNRTAPRVVLLVLVMVTMATIALESVPQTMAATNQATGDIAGNPGDLTPSNIFNLSSSTLALIKRAFLNDGTPIATGATVPRGTVVKFLIYVNNNTAIPVTDLSARDVLDPLFAYQAGTIRVDNSVVNCALASCTGAEETAIYTAVNAAAVRTDAIDADVASYSGGSTTIDAGNQNVANGQLNVLANRVWAMIFTVVMQ